MKHWVLSAIMHVFALAVVCAISTRYNASKPCAVARVNISAYTVNNIKSDLFNDCQPVEIAGVESVYKIEDEMEIEETEQIEREVIAVDEPIMCEPAMHGILAVDLPESSAEQEFNFPFTTPNLVEISKVKPVNCVITAKPVAGNAQPEYPHKAREDGIQGTVKVRLFVSADGEVERSEIAVSSGSDLLDMCAIDALSRWKFLPAHDGSVPVPCTVVVPVSFRLID